MRRIARTLLVIAVLVAPASVAGASAVRRVTCPANAPASITTAYETVFNRALDLGADARAALLVDGDDPRLRAVLATWLAEPTSSASTVTVGHVRCRSRTRAVVDVDLSLSGTTLPRVLPPGRAVLEAGTWKVARKTFCTRMILEDPALADTGACARR